MSEYEFAESPEEINLLIKKFLELKPFDTVILNHWDESISGKHHDYSEECIVTNIDDIDHGSKAKGIFAKGKSGIGNKLSYRIMGLG